MEKLKIVPQIIITGKNGRDILGDLRYLDDGIQKPVIILCHGFKGFKDWGHFNLLANSMAEQGFIVFKFNFSHNGGTMEDPIDFPDLNAFSENTYIKELNDIEVVLDEVNKSRLNNELKNWNQKTYLIGHSRGGGVSILKASEDDRIQKLVTWAAIADVKDLFPNAKDLRKWKESGVYYIKNGRTFQDMPMDYAFVEEVELNSERLSIESACRKLKVPHLILHGTKDPTVKVGRARYIKSWNMNAEIFEIDQAEHTFGGTHPFEEDELPEHSQILIEKTVQFLKNS